MRCRRLKRISGVIDNYEVFCPHPKWREKPEKKNLLCLPFSIFIYDETPIAHHNDKQMQTKWACYWNLKCRQNESTKKKKLKSVTVFGKVNDNGYDYSSISFIQCEEGSIISELKCARTTYNLNRLNCRLIQISNHFSSTGVECRKTGNEYEKQSNAFMYSINLVCFATGIHFNLLIRKLCEYFGHFGMFVWFHLDNFFRINTVICSKVNKCPFLLHVDIHTFLMDERLNSLPLESLSTVLFRRYGEHVGLVFFFILSIVMLLVMQKTVPE